MYETNVRFLNGVSFEVDSRGHKIICDQPAENGGADAGMTPPELMLASLGTCAGFYAVQYLKARKLSEEGLNVRVTGEKAMNPPRIGSFRIEVESQYATDERHREGLRRAVEKCLIHHTLMHAPTIEIAIQQVPAAV
ncbi:MAG: OsmC family protein [Acidobacteria bacterium]|nr:OsmC family protein [Acidobacteriota bacterium]